jgi:hypothetical protein
MDFSAGLIFNAKAQGRKDAKENRIFYPPPQQHCAGKYPAGFRKKIAGGMGWLVILKTQIIRG